MRTEWMGRYRELVRALVYSTNLGLQFNAPKPKGSPRPLTPAQEWQILEYIIEFEDDDECMAYISKKLCIPKSSLTKYTRHLCQIGFVRRYQKKSNRKNIILKATPEGKEYYARVVESKMKPVFMPFFEKMDDIPDEDLLRFIRAMECYNEMRSTPPGDRRLVPMDDSADANENDPNHPADARAIDS